MDEDPVDAETFAPRLLHDAIARLGKFGEDREDGPRPVVSGSSSTTVIPGICWSSVRARARGWHSRRSPLASGRAQRRRSSAAESSCDEGESHGETRRRRRGSGPGARARGAKERRTPAANGPDCREAVADHLNEPEELDPRAGREKLIGRVGRRCSELSAPRNPAAAFVDGQSLAPG